MSFEHIPQEMRDYQQWVVWRLEASDGPKPKKVPYSPRTGERASVTQPHTWATYAEATAAIGHSFNGIGFVLTATDPFCFIDFDDTGGDAELLAWHKSVHDTFATYSEWSPSGTGIHAILKGVVPHGRRGSKLEVYSDLRFMTMTGEVYNDAPIFDRQEMVAELFERLGGSTDASDNGFDGSEREPDVAIVARMMAAANGKKAKALYEGRWQPAYASQSEADFALINIIAHYTDSRAQVARIFRTSALGQRAKAKRDEYLAPMIAKGFDRKLAEPDVSGVVAELDAMIAANRALQSPIGQLCRPRFKLLSGTDLKALPPLRWRVKCILPATGLAVAYGPSTAGKSFLALDMACAIAEGREWFDYRTIPAEVVYLALEGMAGFRGRVVAWEQANGRTLPEGIRVILDPFKLKQPLDVAELAKVCPQGCVVFIDTLARAGDDDENDPKQRAAVIEAAMKLQAAIDGLVVLIAHTGKDKEKGIRGTKSLFDTLDASIFVDRNGDARSWKADKVKDGRDGIAHTFRLNVMTIGTDEDGDDITSCTIEADDGLPIAGYPKPLAGAAQVALQAFNEVAASDGLLDDGGAFTGLPLNIWREAFYAKHEGDTPDAKRKAFNRAKRSLIELQFISEFSGTIALAGPNSDSANSLIAELIRQRDSGT